MKENEDDKDNEYCKRIICSLLIERGAHINCKNEQVN